jgi:hypothetical protein
MPRPHLSHSRYMGGTSHIPAHSQQTQAIVHSGFLRCLASAAPSRSVRLIWHFGIAYSRVCLPLGLHALAHETSSTLKRSDAHPWHGMAWHAASASASASSVDLTECARRQLVAKFLVCTHNVARRFHRRDDADADAGRAGLVALAPNALDCRSGEELALAGRPVATMVGPPTPG